MTAGAVCLSREGCGYFDRFVVTGPERSPIRRMLDHHLVEC
jgi:hypothetical protein